MKATFFKISITSLIISYLLTSCLGSTSSKVHPENSLSYIAVNDVNFTNYAITQEGLWITSQYIKGLIPNNFYYLNYEWSSKDPVSSSGIYSVENTKAGKDGVHPIQNMGTKSFIEANLTDYPKSYQDDDTYPYITNFEPKYYSPYTMFNDQWVVFFQTYAYAEDVEPSTLDGRINIMPVVVLQPSLQGADDTRAILNVYLERIDKNKTVDKSKDRKIYGTYAVVDMSRVRNYFINRIGYQNLTKEPKPAYMQFQFYKYNKEDKKYDDKVTSVGGFPAPGESLGGTSIYGMYIYKQDN